MIKDVLTNRFTAKHWDRSKSIDQSIIDYIVDCTYLAPSKMAAHLHKIMIITDSDKGKEIKNTLYYGKTWHMQGVQGEEHPVGQRGFNGQYIAPIVIAWLNPLHAKENIIKIYNGIPTNVNLPNFQQRHNDIFLSSMCAMLAAEEQGLNTGFGSCHDHLEVAELLGFNEYRCPIVVGIGYAKDMSEQEKLYGNLIPIFDPRDSTNQLGYDATNLFPGGMENPNKKNTPSKESMFITI